MASQTTPDVPARPASPASSEDEHHAELVWLEVSTIDEILDHIVRYRQSGTESILRFCWQASQVDDLAEQLDARLIELDERKIRRFEYDYESEIVYLDIMSESLFHYQVQAGLRDYLKASLGKLLVATEDTTIRDLIRSAKEQGTASIKWQNKLLKQADTSFGQSEPRHHVESKARHYIDSSDGKIQAVLILDLQYPGMKKAWVSLRVGDDPSSPWIQHHELFHDDALDQQPVGQVDLYLSDFVGRAGVPAAYCRPSTAEPAAGITRNPMVTLAYERLRAIFRRARHLHNPTEFTTEVGDEEENPYEEMEEMKRRVAEAERRVTEAERRMAEAELRMTEARLETERRVAEARNEERMEMERRLAKERVEMERRTAVGFQQHVAEGRRERE